LNVAQDGNKLLKTMGAPMARCCAWNAEVGMAAM
jgi:hypothetical protein